MAPHDATTQRHLMYLDSQAKFLEDSASHFRSEIADIRNSMATVTKLPNEILVEIFQHGQKMDSRTGDRFPFTFLVSQVVRHWRVIAAGVPSLWSTIHASPHLQMKVLGLYLQRSEGCLLDILVTGDLPNTCQVWKSLILQLPRFRSLKIISTEESELLIYNIAHTLRNSAAPHLEYLVFCLVLDDMEPWGDMDHVDEYQHIFGGGAPMLSAVELQGVGLHSCRPPLGAVTSLKLVELSSSCTLDVPVFVDVLWAASCLRHLTLDGWLMDFDSYHGVVPNITMTTLLTLDLVIPEITDPWSTDYFTFIFSIVNTPELRNLSVYGEGNKWLPGLLDYFHSQTHTPRFPALQRLWLMADQSCEPSAHVDGLMHNAPTLSELVLTGIDATVIMNQLVAGDKESYMLGKRCLWPRLQTLRIDKVDINSLSNLVTSRMGEGCPMLKLQLRSALFDEISSVDMQWLRERIPVERDEEDFTPIFYQGHFSASV